MEKNLKKHQEGVPFGVNVRTFGKFLREFSRKIYKKTLQEILETIHKSITWRVETVTPIFTSKGFLRNAQFVETLSKVFIKKVNEFLNWNRSESYLCLYEKKNTTENGINLWFCRFFFSFPSVLSEVKCNNWLSRNLWWFFLGHRV